MMLEEKKDESTVIGAVLKRCDFKQLIAEKQKDHYPGTREWLFADIRSFLHSANNNKRLFWVAGAAGTGKSVVSAKLLETEGVAERIVAWHFCRHDHVAESSVQRIIESWAAMMSEKVAGFVISEEVKSKAFAASTSLEMFAELIAKPLEQLGTVAPPEGPLLVVLDALDELPRESVAPVLDLIADVFETLPSFVKLCVTSRYEDGVKARLSRFEPVEIHLDELRSRGDVRAYFTHVARGNFKMTSADLEANLEREFKLDPGTLQNKLSRIEDDIRLSNHFYNDVVAPFKDTAAFRSVCEVKDIVHPDLRQSENDLVQLYEDARVARERLLQLFASEWEEFRCIVSEDGMTETRLRQPVRGSAVEWVDNVIDPGLKSEISARLKIKDSYGGEACRMTDLVRFTLACKNCKRLCEVLRRLQQEAGIEVVMLRNKFANPTLLGYCDFNLSVRVALAGNRSHICEVQVNLMEMILASGSELAKVHYEKVREMIPAICDEAGINEKDRFEKSVMKMLRGSVLDVAVEQLESKSGGLFLYATLLARELESRPVLDMSQLRELPSDLSAIYERNFTRMVGGSAFTWEEYKRVVSMITVSREPLPGTIVQQVLGVTSFEEISRSLSVLFPIRDGCFHVMHKSVVDWLLGRPNELYSVSSEDCERAHHELAVALLALVRGLCGVSDVDYGTVSREGSFALRQVSHHLCAAGLVEDAHALVRNFDWLLARVATGDPAVLLADVESVNERQARPSTKLVVSALRLALGALHEDWRHLAGQLVGRLLGHVAVDEVYGLLQQVCKWRGPSEGWWCPVEPTLEQAGGSTLLVCWHSFEVPCAQWSSDAKWICSGSRDSTVRVWEVSSGNWGQTSNGHSDPVISVSWSSDDSRICSGSNDTTVRVWEMASGGCTQIFEGHSDIVTSVSWSSDDNYICSGSGDKTVRVWEVASGKCLQTLGHPEVVTSVSWSRDGSNICSGSNDSIVRVWDSLSGECVQTFTGHSHWVRSVSWSSDDSKICSGSNDMTVKVWEVSSGECMQTFIGHVDWVRSVSWSKDDTKICSGSKDNTLRLWEVSSGQCVQTFTGRSSGVTSVHWSNDSSNNDNTMKVWILSNGGCVQTFNGHSYRVTSVSWSSDGSKVCIGGDDKTVRVWEMSRGECTQTLTGYSSSDATLLAWSSDDSEICNMNENSSGKTVRVWEVASGKCLFEGPSLDGYPHSFNEKQWEFSFRSGGPIGFMAGMRYLMFSSDSPRAFAQMGGEDTSLHPLQLVGGSRVEAGTAQFLTRHREAALAQAAEAEATEGKTCHGEAALLKQSDGVNANEAIDAKMEQETHTQEIEEHCTFHTLPLFG